MDRLETCMDALRVLAKSNARSRGLGRKIHRCISHDRDGQCVACHRAPLQGIRDEHAEGREGENCAQALALLA